MKFIRRTALTILGGTVLFAMSACYEWHSPDENVLTVYAGAYVPDGGRTFATVEIPGRTTTLNEEQLNANAQFAVHPKHGTIRVRFVRVKGAADTIGRGEISFEIVKGYTYYAGLTRDHAGIPNYCIGCSGWLTFPMIGSEHASTDSLRLHYVHGLPLCKGCVARREDKVVTLAQRE